MKKTLWILLLTTILTYSVFATGKQEEEPQISEVPEATVAAAPSETAESGQTDMTELYIRLNRAGFDTPTEALPSIDFELANLQGLNEKLSDYKGQVVFLNFWATWCGPCRSEMPAMEEVYRELKDDGFVILAVDLAEETQTVQDFVDDYGLTFPVLLDQTGQVGGMYDARSIPTTYLVDRDGNILGRAIGARPWEDDAYMDLFRDILKM